MFLRSSISRSLFTPLEVTKRWNTGPGRAFVNAFMNSIQRQVKENQQLKENIKLISNEATKFSESNSLKKAKEIMEKANQNVVKIHVLLYLFAFAQFLVCAPFAKVASTHENDVEPLNFDNFTLPLFKRQEGKKKYEVHLLLLIDNVKKEDEEKEREKAIKFISNINSIMRKTGLTIPLIQFKAAHVDFVDHSLMNEGGKLDGPFNNWKREFAKVKKPEYHAGVQLIHSRGGGVIGWAGVDVLCSGMASASVSGYQPDTNGVYKTTFIHEVFHILGVNHDEDLGCRGSIMAAANSGSRKVSSCTNNVLEKTMPKFASRKNCIQLVDDDGTDDGSADADGDKFDTDSNDYNFDNTPVDEGGRYTVRYEHGYNYNHEENEWVPEPSTSSSSEALETSTTSTSIDPETSTTIASSAENGALVSTLSNTELNPSITTINISPTTSSENPDPKKETVPIQGPSLTTTGTSIEATTTVPILTTTTFSPTPPPIQETSATSVIEEISKNNFSTKEPELHEISSDESEKGTVPIQDPSLTTSVTSIEATTTDPTLTTTTFSSTAPPIQEASSTSVIEQISKNESSTKGKKKYEVHLLLLIDNVKKEDEEKEREKAIKFISNINSIMRKTGLTIPLIQFKAAHVDFVDHSLMNEGGKLDGPFNNWKREFAKVKKPEYHAGVQLIHSRGGGVIGWAGVDVLCSGMASASVSGYQPDTNGVYKTTFIHEVFHILGVNHDEDLGCRGSIMAAANSGSRKVSSCTNNVLEKTMPKFASRKNCIQLVDDDGTDDGSADADGDKFDTDSNDYNFDNTPVDEGGRYTVRYEHGYNYNHEENEWVPEPSTSSSSEALETSTTSTSIDPETSTTIASSAENGALVSTLSNTELNPSITTINISPTTSSENPDPKKETVPIQGPSLTTTGTSIEATTTVPILTTTTFSPTPPPIQETSATSVIEEISKNNFSTKEPELHEISSDESEKGTVPIQDPSLTTSVTSIEATTTDPTLTTTTFSSTAPPIQEASSTSVIEQISKNESSTKVPELDVRGPPELNEEKKDTNGMTKHEIPSEGMTASNQDLSHSATGTSIKATTTDPIKVSTTFSSTTSPMQVTSSEVAPEDLYNPGYAYPGNPHLKDNKDPGTSDSGKGKMDADSLTKQKKDSEKVTSSKEGSSLLPPISPTQETLTKADKGNNAAFELKDDFALQNLDTPSNNNPLFSPTKGKSPEIHSDLNDLDALLFSDEDFSKGPSGNRKGRALNGFKKGAPPADSTSITSGISSASHSVKPIISGKPTIPPSILSTLTSSSTVLSTIIPSQPSDPRNSNKGSTKAIKTSVSLSSTVLSTIIPSQPSDPRNSNKGSTKAIKTSGKKKYEVHLLLLIDNVKKEDEEKEREKAIKFISNINSIMRKTGLTIPLIQFKAAHVDFVDHSLMNEGGKLDGPFNNWKREFAKVKKPEYHAGVQLIHSRGGGVIGWAGVDVLCSGMASASVSGYQPDTNGVYKTTFIHEVFHILGVNHDEDLGCRGSIMAAANSGSRKVSSCTNNVLEKTMPKFASRKNCIQLVDDDGTDDGSADADGDKFDTDSNDYNFDNTPVDEGGRYTVRYEHGYNYNHEENEWVPEPSTSSSSEALETSTTSTSIDPETSTTIASSAENGALVSTLSNTELNPSITTINISPTTSSENPDPKKETVPIQGPSLTTTGTSIEATTTVPILTTTTFSPTPPPIQETSATSVIEEISKNNFSTKEPELHEISSDESEKGTVPIQDPSLTTSVTSIEATTTDPTLTTTTFSSTAPPIQEASSTSVIEQISKNESSTKVPELDVRGPPELNEEKKDTNGMTKHEIPSEGMTASNQDLSHSATGTSIKATTTDPIKVSTTFSSTTSPMQVTSSEVAPEDLYNPGYAYPGNPHLKDNKDPGTSDSGKGKMDADSLTKQKKDSEKVTSSKEGSSLLPPISPTQETLTKADKGNNAAFELKDDFALQNLDTPSNNNPLFSPTKGKSPEIHSDLNDLDALLFSDEDFSKGPSGNRKGRALNGFKKGAPPADSTSITSGISSASHSVKPIISGKPTIPPSILSTLTSSSTVLSTIIPSQPSDPRNSNKGSTKVIKNSVSLSSTVLPTIFPSRTSDPRILNKDSTKVIKNSITSSYSRQPLKPGITEAPVVRTDLEQSYTPKTPTVRKNSNKQEKKNIKPNNSVPLNDPSNRHVALLPASGASSPEKDRKE
ncbi:hypothetical protein HMI54_012545, partial [Coelomomyces lativittatus]